MIANSAQITLRAAAALLLATTSLAAQAAPSASFVPQIVKTQLADGVFLLAGGPGGYVDGTNTVVVVNDTPVKLRRVFISRVYVSPGGVETDQVAVADVLEVVVNVRLAGVLICPVTVLGKRR